MPAIEMNTIKIKRKVSLGLMNRDGYLIAVESVDGKFFLVLEADTFCNAEIFEGMGSTVSREISKTAFDALTK
mgnify:CR=1 FL=1